MRRTTKSRLVAVLLLLVILLGASVTISIAGTEVLFAVAIVIIVGVVMFSIIGSCFKKRRK
jgi:hypothetical protein